MSDAAEVDRLRAELAELNNALTWDTTCLNCAHLLDGSYAQTMRAELAEARIAAALALADRWTAIHGHDQRAATHHALADDLREVLGGGS